NDAWALLAGNGATNNALDSYGNYNNGAKPKLNTAIDTNKDDKFLIAPGTSANTWVFKTQWNTGLCVDNPGGQTANGTQIQLWSCNGGSNQNWIVTNRPSGGVQIKNQQSGKCLFNQWSSGGDDGAGISIQDCDVNNYGEVWALTAN
ncbi:MAG: RICIN domain-containing protein, partial [Verrucomicrobiota bacterium]